LDNKTNTSNYTFLNDKDILTYNSSTTYLKDETNIEEQNILEKKEEKYKKKKVMTKSDTTNSRRGLKFLNQSQRNHSSVYE
jgi:hypothetical protein